MLDQLETIIDPNSSYTAKLQLLLEALNVTKVYYVDDEHMTNVGFADISTVIKLILPNSRKKARLTKLVIPGLDFSYPDNIILDSFEKEWETFDKVQRGSIYEKVIGVYDLNQRKQLERTERLAQLFPPGLLILLDPNQWVELQNSVDTKLGDDERILILFDQELTKAGGRFNAHKGETLIIELKQKQFKERVICALLSNYILDTSDEMPFREDVIASSNGALLHEDFFALSKSRIEDNDLFCDGIKKVLLNTFCEFIKDNSIKIIEDAYAAVVKKIKAIDTYDFDHTVLRSSYHEGVWEAETFFRISKNHYDNEIKRLMISKSYSANVNPAIKRAKSLSDVRFNIQRGTHPYKEKYKLRHQDIYVTSDLISPLHLPLENGDVFKIYEGAGQGSYILVAQECDLMMRNDSDGKRRNEFATLVKVDELTRDELQVEVEKFFKSNGGHYFSNKFRLDYFISATNDVGVAKFNSAYFVNLEVLDLVVFNIDGRAATDISLSFNVDMVSSSWEERYNYLKKLYKKEAKKQSALLADLGKVSSGTRPDFQKNIYSRLSPVKNLGITNTFDGSSIFTFGIKRTGRLKYPGCKYLLDHYYKHLARNADQHDFANDKTI